MKCVQRWTLHPNLGLCLLVFIALSHIQYSVACPKDCFCPQHSNNVYCSRKRLPAIPMGIPFNTVELNLNENEFENQVLSRRNFTNLNNLENLYLSNCGIKTITLDTFKELKKLKWLDISKNNIEFIADFTFRGLDLEHLFMNDNPGIQLSNKAFDGLSSRGLYMHRCDLVNLSKEVLRPLDGTLLALWLDENKFEQFPFVWLQQFNLSHLRLGNNPFHCNCELTWLYKYYTGNPSVFSGGVVPSCSSPVLNRGKMFTQLKPEDFRCELPTFKNVDAVFEVDLAKLSCTASGDPTPSVFWVRPDGTTETFYPPTEDDVRDNEGIMYVTDLHLKDSSVFKCVASNPAGNVTFTLNVAWPPEKPTSTGAAAQHPSPATVLPISDDSRPRGEDSYGWTANKAEKKLGVMADHNSVEGYFTIVDIVGAVVGTFLLTLLVCVVVFHFYYKRRERLKYEEAQVRNDKKRSPNNLYNYMAEPDENCLKMINHSNDTSIPS
ncbi:leucine-rich repeat and fibronectin type-III domain-containing protein 5-like [Haliotis rubra]|uniref:leucine-rich repeat and fibronectin type-III domain-containing protein 5-like n=1 Tax=Haliotis rubra TaxID=36100 RepID=UPI001EE500B3|nr:leucine-rich repeat and fibronectin type-III domain-containing protein 5-like [Haliotis rubra]